MPAAVSVAGHKRFNRSDSANAILRLDDVNAKRQETGPAAHEHPATQHILRPAPGESKAVYFQRLSSRLRRDLFSPATTFDRDGLYLYKRPVRSENGDKASLLASGGTVFNHVVVYVKSGDELTSLEFCPANDMDITDNMMLEAEAAPVLQRPALPTEPDCLPMLHVAAPHHPLEAEHVQRALAYAQGTKYHALRNNCIAFADFVVRVLTGGTVKCVPLLFDLLVGKVPPVDSPMLPILTLMAQLHWHDVCDGSRLLRGFMQTHPDALLPPPASNGSDQKLTVLLPETAATQADVAEAAAVPSIATEQAVPVAAAVSPAEASAQLSPDLAASLAAFLGSSEEVQPLATAASEEPLQ